MWLRYGIFIVFIYAFFIAGNTQGQELNCQVRVSAPGMPDRDRQIMETLSSELEEFVNQRNWTDHQFEPNERIEASISITIDEKEGEDVYKGRIQVQSRRPVYNSSYSSPLLNINDRNLQFTYREGEPLEYSESSFRCDLTSVVAYYVYIIIGFDFDTFSPKGGTPFFQKAENIVNMAQSSSASGWRSHEGQQNRYWLVENLFNSQYEPIREALYKYHREGFDKMADNIDEGRKNVTEALELLKEAHRQRPGSYLMQIIMVTKNDELVNLFSEAPSQEQNTAQDILTEIDPSNARKYRQITESR